MAENPRPHEPGRLGPVAEGQIELNRRLAQESPDASREQVHEQQEALQRDRPEVVHEAAAKHREDRKAEVTERSPSADAPAPSESSGGP